MKPLPKLAWILGYAGLLPFVSLTVLLSIDESIVLPVNLPLAWWQATYAAIIISFLGAVSWGVALAMQDQMGKSAINKLLVYSVTPSVLAWFALLLPAKVALICLAGLIVLIYLADLLLVFPRINSQYSRLRLYLTIIVTALLCISALAI